MVESAIYAATARKPAEAISRPVDGLAWRSTGLIASGVLDLRSLAYGLGAASGFFILASLCLALWRFDATLASVWLPNASAVAVLLLARLRNEWPLLAGVAVGSVMANWLAGNPFLTSLIFTLANLCEVMLVPALLRFTCRRVPDMSDLSELGRFLQYGALIAPLVSMTVASFALIPASEVPLDEMLSWFIADCVGMIVIVPGALVIAEAIRSRTLFNPATFGRHAISMLAGLAVCAGLFRQDTYPILFIVPLVTLVIAFRVGSVGTAVFVPCVAALSAVMTFADYGPIANDSTTAISELFVLQSFLAANFLTGLPIVAILAGRDRLTGELLKGREELRLVTANVSDAVLKLDRDFVVTYASPSTREVLQRDPSELLGGPVHRRMHVDSHARMDECVRRLATGESEKERITYRRLHDCEDGTPAFIEADCAVARSPQTGERVGYVVSLRDVTERVELELLLTRARRTAENAARAKSEFLANMSHEIRTPMNGVLGFAELILQGELDEEHRRHTEMIVQSGRSMMLLLNDILDLSKIEAGQIAVDEGPVDLFRTLNDCVMLHGASAQNKGIALDLVCEGPDPRAEPWHGGTGGIPEDRPWILTDALRLRQIVLNLVGNAVKFTEQGSVTLHCKADADAIRIAVSDTGIGISPSRIKSIFAPFTQGEGDIARRFGGTGLGLTISRQLAELLGGTIEVESFPGEGSTFTLTLPAEHIEADERDEIEPPAIEPADLPQHARVLLVEDHDVNRMLGTEMLERCGQSVAIAHDGNEAIAMVIDSVMRDKPFDLVLMDIQMPGCDGYAATRAIRAEGIGPDTLPIIALTANAFPEDVSAALNAGMQAHLAKPLVFADLARALQRWLPTRIVDIPCDEGEQPVLADAYAGNGLRDDESDGADAEPFAGALPPPVCESATARIDDRRHRREEDTREQSFHSPRPELPGPAAARTAPGPGHSPALVARWTERRGEAVEAVRGALESGELAKGVTDERSETLMRLVHKLAGTAAIFGEAELGDQAAAFERALRSGVPGSVQETLAFELLSVADDPEDTIADHPI
ncbi:ATP-binding protein [Qipengyuania nanhaisediminis]|uniref:ATP-binding protein n=1 Tax=Qipengyuania nanhaisediminis TaxID=604088 RepID=UPI0038B26506